MATSDYPRTLIKHCSQIDQVNKSISKKVYIINIVNVEVGNNDIQYPWSDVER